ncbi:T9SS type A sorting domain-containing protein [uncultured Dokdonia sp.]|uniref:T9SS type A sorting domain-containing protein n=1 Tax=uncultured Dokdonia sp. TaxID=575653 RepID=UPI00261EB0E0|nr:T9SS type A sorting domain-containing protein [uncultured Dokdonia sp.]
MKKLLFYILLVGCVYTTQASIASIENPPVDLYICDDDNDGFATFDLTQNNAIVLGTQNPADFQITYHISQADATTNVNPIPNANAFTSMTTTIFIRVEEIANSNMFEIGVFNVFVNDNPPIATPLPDLIQCNDGSNQAVFDLHINTPTIIGNLDPTDYTVTYHESQTDATNNALPIGNPLNYLVSAPGTVIWARLESATTGCFSIASFNVIINPQPVFTTPDPVEVCDDIESGSDVDELATFDLNSLAIDATNGDPNLAISFHLTQSDANNSQNPLPDMYQNVTPGIQTVWMLVWITAPNSCSSVVPVTLIVNALPSPSSIPNVIVCDDTNDGIGFFDLAPLQEDILNGETNASLTFHETLEDAEIGTPSIDITIPYESVANPQILYVRATDIDPLTTTECFRIITITLEAFPIPITTTPSDYEVCDDDNDGIFNAFVLSSRNDEITGGAPDVEVIYYFTESDAINAVVGIDIDDMNYINSNDPFFQTVYARIENTISGCFAIEPLNLVVLNTPEINNTPSAYSVCDNDSDGLGFFDLTTRESEILNGLNPANYEINWFVNQVAVDNNVPIADPTNYTSNASTVIAVVTDIDQSTTTFCSAQVTLELNLNACVDTDDDGVPDEEEDLNGNGDLEDDDTDNDDIPNYLDDDDDGDLVMTIDEITGIGAGIAPQDFIDTDDDMIENYLDDDDDGDGVLTIDEDYNNSGSPLDDDTNDNDIPDFLDPDVALSIDDFEIANFAVYPNPTTANITITGTIPFDKISVYDITGKLLLEQTIASQIIHTVVLPSIKKGIYFIRIDNQSQTLRFIKK